MILVLKMSFSEDFPNFELNISDTETYIPDWGRDLDEVIIRLNIF